MKSVISAVFVLLIALALGDGIASANERVTEFDVHVGDAFILGIGLPAVDIAGASNGDTIELLFTGRVDVKDREAEGDGGFRHFDKSGKLVDFGTFTAKRLISFLDLGPAAGAPPTFHRGRAQISVRAVGQTTAFNATLKVDCKFGPAPPPPPDFEEGTFFAIVGGLDFNKTVNETTYLIYLSPPPRIDRLGRNRSEQTMIHKRLPFSLAVLLAIAPGQAWADNEHRTVIPGGGTTIVTGGGLDWPR